MTENPYKAPEAELLKKQHERTDQPEELYVVSKKKLILLSVCTFNLYLMYWFYKNFSNLKKAFGESSWPVMRAIFLVFFTHILYQRINEIAKARGVDYKWVPVRMATILVVLFIVDAVISRMGTSWVIALTFVMMPLYLYPLLKAQTVINLSQNDPVGKRNSKLTWANYAWMLFGILIVWPIIVVNTLDILGIVDVY